VSRHRWGPPVVVEAPWSDTGGNLYTCVKCGATRQSTPSGSFFTAEFRLPDGTFVTGKTPPCIPPQT
jgi:hypothetical protein